MAKKPFFYRIDAAEFLSQVVQVDESKRGEWVFRLALDLVAGKSETASTEFAANMIIEAENYTAQKINAAHKRWSSTAHAPHMQDDSTAHAPDMHRNADPMHSNASNRSSNNSSTVPKKTLEAGGESFDFSETEQQQRLRHACMRNREKIIEKIPHVEDDFDVEVEKMIAFYRGKRLNADPLVNAYNWFQKCRKPIPIPDEDEDIERTEQGYIPLKNNPGRLQIIT